MSYKAKHEYAHHPDELSEERLLARQEGKNFLAVK